MNHATSPVSRLPIAATVTAAFASLAEHFPAVLRLFWFPFLAIAAADLTSRTVGMRQLDPLEVTQDAAVLGGVALVMTLATVAVVPAATAWHRLILFGPKAAPPRFHLGVKELRYALYLVLYCAVVIAAGVPSGLAVFYGALELVALGVPIGFVDIESLVAAAAMVGMGLALFATVRLFLLFPGIAIGSRIGLREAGRASHGNQVRLFVASVIPMAPVSLLRALTETVPEAGLALQAAASVAGTALLIPFFAASVSVLSLSYRALCQPQPESRGAPLPVR